MSNFVNFVANGKGKVTVINICDVVWLAIACGLVEMFVDESTDSSKTPQDHLKF